ncbi:hypothetical protein BKA83DRAFT_4126700 [Pisolithus microcarpus]|nr:hypothetical protein BKA83DRAFT_4126700 [Pisolithus microcarpus]
MRRRESEPEGLGLACFKSFSSLFDSTRQHQSPWVELTPPIQRETLKHRAKAGDNGNFKSSTYHSAAQHITQHLTSGPMKTTAMVRNKWLSHIQKIYQDLEGFHTKSGCHWDNTCGAGVQGKFDKEVFEDYAKVHHIHNIPVDELTTCGTNAFTPGTSYVSTMDYDTEHPLATSNGGE